MTKMLNIDYDCHTENLGGYDPNDEWSRDSTHSSYNVTRATIAKQHGDCPISDCEVGDTIYVVWADYVTGDTFGSDSAIEFLAAFKNPGRANRCETLLRHDTDGWNVPITLDGGEEYNVHIPWNGYFEHLENIHVTELVVEE